MPWLLLNKTGRLYRKFGLTLPPGGDGKKRIWIHALSVGEVISAQPLIEHLKKRFPGQEIVLTVKTDQGMEVARQKLINNVDALYFMPLDFWWSMVRLVKLIRPSVFILIETDIWPGIISYLKKINIKIILVNGRVSPGTFRGYKRLRFYFRKILSDIELFLMQSELDSGRLREVGIPSEKIKTVGNIKFDREWAPMDEKEREDWLKRMKIGSGSKILIAGSTHEGEEKIVLNAYKRLLKKFPGLILILAPRKIDRADTILRLGEALGLSLLKRTDLEKCDSPDFNVLLLNTIGELGRVYGLATVSFVGGSLVPIGGHNLLEPAVFGRPVLYGKYTHNFVLMSELLSDAGGGKIVKDEEDLFNTLKYILSDSNEAKKMGKNAGNFVKANSGAISRVMDYIGGYIASN